MILIIDNYDSFTYNLYQFIGEINPDIEVHRNDRITVEKIRDKNPSHIIISPGPGFPKDAGISTITVKKLGRSVPILGICLGHQAIGEAYGGKTVHAAQIMHGKNSIININTECKLFKKLPEQIIVGRYHSLIIQKQSLSSDLKIIAETSDGEIMGVKHKESEVYGLQFHPESVLTPYGKDIIENFVINCSMNSTGIINRRELVC